MDRDAVLATLNEINQLDPAVLPALMAYRVPCNAALAEHPTVQVGLAADGYEVGWLGIINGLVGVGDDGWGYIAAIVNANGRIDRFELLDRAAALDDGGGA